VRRSTPTWIERMTMHVQTGAGLAALRSSQRGSSFIQTIVLTSALALGTAVAVKSLSGRIGETLDCTGQKVTSLGLGAGGCAEGGGQAPVALDFRLASAETPIAEAETPIAEDPAVRVAPASLSLSPVPAPTPGATPIAPQPEATPPVQTPTVQPTPSIAPTPTPSIAPTPELTPPVPVTPTPETTPTPSPEPGPSPDPDAPRPDRPPGFVDGFVGGDFTDCESFGCAAGQAISGFIPFVGDGRDVIANGADCAAGEGCGDLVFTGIGFIPIIGDLIKGGRKVVKAADAADTAADAADAARRADPPAKDPDAPAKDPADTAKSVSGTAADIARLGGRVVDISKLKVNPSAKNRIFLGHFGGRGLIVNGRLIRVPSAGLQALESLAKEHGGRTLADFPGDITAIAPELRNADEIIFNVGERGIGAGTLTAEELGVLVNEGLLDKVTFVTGLTF
jgi:hypothetical protein